MNLRVMITRASDSKPSAITWIIIWVVRKVPGGRVSFRPFQLPVGSVGRPKERL